MVEFSLYKIKKFDDVEIECLEDSEQRVIITKITESFGLIGLGIGDIYIYMEKRYKIINIRVNNPYAGLGSVLPTSDNGGFLAKRHSGAMPTEEYMGNWIFDRREMKEKEYHHKKAMEIDAMIEKWKPVKKEYPKLPANYYDYYDEDEDEE